MIEFHSVNELKIERFETVLREIKNFLINPEWGTWPYMESTRVYDDKDRILNLVLDVLDEK